MPSRVLSPAMSPDGHDPASRSSDEGWDVSSSGWLAVLATILGLGGQIVAFLYAFDAAQTGASGRARLSAIGGLVVTLAVLAVMARLVDREWVSAAPALGFLGAGAFVGGIVTVFQTSGRLGPAGELYLYTVALLITGAFVTGLLLMGSGMAYAQDHPWWRPLAVAPILLYTGAHAVLFVGMLVQAGRIDEAAALIPLA